MTPEGTFVDLLVYRQYEYRGMKIIVEIDRLNKTASLVERVGNGFQPKKWEFAGRSLEYMNGWRLIFDAMDYAIIEARKELEKFKDEDINKLVNIMVKLNKLDEENN